jgi:hypothetical protein
MTFTPVANIINFDSSSLMVWKNKPSLCPSTIFSGWSKMFEVLELFRSTVSVKTQWKGLP